MKPVVALVGRPNVGKSTLFNRITRTRDAIVADYSGLTRDRHYGHATHEGHGLIIVDTGGFEPDASAGIVKEMAKQTQQAVAEADIVIFVTDVRAGLTTQDHDITKYLRVLGKPTLLAVNKAEGMAQNGAQLAEFYELGIGVPLPIAASHGQGVRDLMDLVIEELGLAEVAEESPALLEPPENQPIKLAVAGKPNVGKSTLINTWLGEERLVTYDDMGGTTRDAISVSFERMGQAYELIDTAGLRRKGKVFQAIEKFSVVKTLQAIDGADVVLLLVDATQGVTDQDAHIAGYILESGRAVVIAINKWDVIDSYQKEGVLRTIDQRLGFLKFAQIFHISALKRQGLGPLWKAINEAHTSAYSKLSTPKLTRTLREAVEFQQPKRGGASRPKLRYAHQGGVNPPIVIVHGTALNHVTDVYKRYLEGRFREVFKLTGTPMRIEFRSAKNPYVDKVAGKK